jgi:dephospho-CoA kinase
MKQNKKVIVITGSISTGKSTIANFIRKKGYLVLDIDKIAHEVLEDPEINKKVSQAFNMDFSENGKFSRKKLSEYAFKDENRLKILNNIMHREIFNRLNKYIQESKDRLVFADIPLIIELIDTLDDYNFKYDQLWLVYVDKEEQEKRLMLRDNISKEEARQRINFQMSIEDKKKYADEIIENYDIKDAEKQVENLLSKL